MARAKIRMKGTAIRPWVAAMPVAILIISMPGTCFAGAPKASELVQNSMRIPDKLGPPPAIDPSEYGLFRRPGNNSLIVQIGAILPNERFLPDHSGWTYLYPDTAFTRWMLRRYAQLADGANKFDHAWPGESGFPVKVPSYLEPGTPDSVVRQVDGQCNQQGICRFSHLPSGHYMLFSKMYLSRLFTVQDTIITPKPTSVSGEYDPEVSIGPSSHGEIERYGGLIILSSGYLDVGQRSSGSAGMFRVAAAFGRQVRYGITDASAAPLK